MIELLYKSKVKNVINNGGRLVKKIVNIRNIKIGEGIPKICIPLVGKTYEDIIEEVNNIKKFKFDLVEWRIDFYKNVNDINSIKKVLNELRIILKETPILVTFRSKKEGGELEISNEEYVKLYKDIILTNNIDLIDVELFIGDEIVKDLIEFSHKNNIKVIISNHDFNKTPNKEEIIKRLCKMQELNADLPKIAVMPKTPSDVLILLSATNEMVTKYADRPIITMSMAGDGLISRISGEVFGSALTFGSAKKASAPGQIPVSELSNILNVIHTNL